MPMSRSIARDALRPPRRATRPPAGRSEIVAAGNCSWWAIDSGAVVRFSVAKETSGTCAPPRDADIELVEDGRVGEVARRGFEDDAILVRLRVDGRDLPLAEGVVQRVVDQLRRDAEPAGLAAVDVDEGPQAAVLHLVGHMRECARRGAWRRRASAPIASSVGGVGRRSAYIGIASGSTGWRSGCPAPASRRPSGPGTRRAARRAAARRRPPRCRGASRPSAASICRLATFGVGLSVPTPSTATTPVTSGSSRNAASASPCSRAMSAKDAVGEPSMMASISPVSCVGQEALRHDEVEVGRDAERRDGQQQHQGLPPQRPAQRHLVERAPCR